MSRYYSQHFLSIIFLYCISVIVFAEANASALPSQNFNLSSLKSSETLLIESGNATKLLAADKNNKGVALRYAIPRNVQVTAGTDDSTFMGRWEQLPDGRLLWRLRVKGAGAVSLDFGFKQFFLPQGAALYFTNADRTMIRGPYTDQDNTSQGAFWTPYILGDTVDMELVVPADKKKFVVLDLATVNWAYRFIEASSSTLEKSASCNIDVACALADPYRNQANAVVRYSAGGFLCTGQLVANTALDRKGLLSTANHCVNTQSAAASLVAYWQYESPTCRAFQSAQNGLPVALSTHSIAQTGGAILRMTYQDADTTLLELNTQIPAAVTPYWFGWDRRDIAHNNAVVIHHPNGDEKRISIEQNALSLINTPVTGLTGNFHYLLNDYEFGTTEPGSSGAGLFNEQLRLVGFLSGGNASCSETATDDSDGDGDNGGSDFYGRLSKAWEGGGTSDTRLKDWLDPLNTQVSAFDGQSQCNAPVINLTVASAGVVSSGVPVTHYAAIAGAGPFTVEWDTDGDGVFERTQNNIAEQTQVTVLYPTQQNLNLAVRVTDSLTCAGQANHAVNVMAPEVVAVAQDAEIVCGDGDDVIEPGEIVSIPVQLTNAGDQAISGGYAVFSSGLTDTDTTSWYDYRQTDNATSSAICAYDYIDISEDVTALLLVPAGSLYNAEDDGHTLVQDIEMDNFKLFGHTITELIMSTNGYLSTDGAESGGDYENSCPLSAIADVRQNQGIAKIMVLHDDLVVQTGGGLYKEYFSVCPRPRDTGGDGACTVFQWRNVGSYQSDGSVVGNADFQVILYAETNEIVYQYRNPDMLSGAGATQGLINTANNDAQQYACNSAGSAVSSRAVCFFDPAHAPISLTPAPIQFTAYAQQLENLAPNESQTVHAEFKVGGVCGQPLNARYVGTVDTHAYTMQPVNILSTTVGAGTETCQIYTGCAVQTFTPFNAYSGMYYSPPRPGSGVMSYFMPQSQAYFGKWYTGEANHYPIWYTLNGSYIESLYANQAQVDGFIYYNLGINNGDNHPYEHWGRAQITYISADRYLLTYDMGHQLLGGDMHYLLSTYDRPTLNLTGEWYAPIESGWGVAVMDNQFADDSDLRVMVHSIYDIAGVPRWMISFSDGYAEETIPVVTYLVACPTCSSYPDFNNYPLSTGQVSTHFTSQIQGFISTEINFPEPLAGEWIRNNLPIYLLTPPEN